jgi:hypothetical protein
MVTRPLAICRPTRPMDQPRRGPHEPHAKGPVRAKLPARRAQGTLGPLAVVRVRSAFVPATTRPVHTHVAHVSFGFRPIRSGVTPLGRGGEADGPLAAVVHPVVMPQPTTMCSHQTTGTRAARSGAEAVRPGGGGRMRGPTASPPDLPGRRARLPQLVEVLEFLVGVHGRTRSPRAGTP